MDDILITIEQGTLKGTTGIDLDGRTYYIFKGIPYAKPPLGKLRFKAPQPPEKWSGIRDATSEGSACFSREMIFQTIIGSEDCLVLNIYTRYLSRNDTPLKPVMVWIHGGGFTSGSNNANMYGPQYLITEDVVIVVINYRLGVLGFLSLEDPNLGVPGNAGCKDMVMALKWVQKNIICFGGDPDNVTIFGSSAGATAVHFLILSPMAKGLFHKAIAQSGCALSIWSVTKSSALELAQILNCPYTKEADILRYMRELPAVEILMAQEKIRDQYAISSLRPIGPIIEKHSSFEPAFLSENPLDIMVQGRYNKVPIIMGYTSREGLIFTVVENMKMVRDLETIVPHSLQLKKGSNSHKAVAKKFKRFYFEDETPSDKNKDKYYLLQSDNCFIWGIYNSVKYHSLLSREPVYLYRFSVDAKLNFFKAITKIEYEGASHADDLGYLFKSIVTPENVDPDGVEMKTVRRMVKLWTNFARTGNPNPIENVVWKPVKKGEINFLDIGVELTTDVNPEKERMEFWDNILK